jgi:hypothetical protein
LKTIHPILHAKAQHHTDRPYNTSHASHVSTKKKAHNVEQSRPGMKKLLCIPHGGLNDTLVQIAKCCEYAVNHNRHLYIDSTRSGIFLDFGRFFEFTEELDVPITTTIDAATYAELNSLSCVKPYEFSGNIYEAGLKHIASPHYKGYIFSGSGQPSSFDFHCDHDEYLLIHLNCGGGIASHTLMPNLRVTQKVRGEILRRISFLPAKYIAIHIRNTDIKTDFISLFEEIRPALRGQNVLICSDDSFVISAAKERLAESCVYSNDRAPGSGKTTQPMLHSRANYRNHEEMYDATIASLSDLFALAFSSHLLITKHREGWYSGFSRLAYYLFENKDVARIVVGKSD